jgi:hypothetical protein
MQQRENLQDSALALQKSYWYILGSKRESAGTRRSTLQK